MAKNVVLNGAEAMRVTTRNNKVVFIALPRELWKPIEGGCCCPYCSEIPAQMADAYWDTLVVPVNGGKVWACHAPEYQGAKRLRPW